MNENEPTVIVIRRNCGEDIVGLYVSDDELGVKVKSPHTVHVNIQEGTLGILPYCLLTDEKYYTFRKSDIAFVAVANERVTNGFLAMTHVTDFDDLIKVLNPTRRDEEFEPIDKPITPGNGTLH